MERRLDNRPLIPPQQFNRQLSGHINDAIVLGMALEKENRPQSMSVWLQQLDSSPSPVAYKYRQEVINSSQVSRKEITGISLNPNWHWSMGIFLQFVLFGILSYIFNKVSMPSWVPVLSVTFGIMLPLALVWFGGLTVKFWMIAVETFVIFIVGIWSLSWSGQAGHWVFALVLWVCVWTLNFMVIAGLADGWIQLEKRFSPFHRFLILNGINFGGLGGGFWLFLLTKN